MEAAACGRCDGPHGGRRRVARAARLEGGDELCAARVVVAQHRHDGGPLRGDPAIDLAAGRGILVEYGYGKPAIGGRDRRRKTPPQAPAGPAPTIAASASLIAASYRWPCPA